MAWAAEHEVGIASDVPEDIKADLRANFEGECSEISVWLASITFAVWLGGSFPPRVFNQILKLLTFTVAGLSLHALNAQQSMATQHKISLIFLMFLWYLQKQIY